MGLFTNKAAKKAEKLMDQAQSRLDDALASRQAIINPYAGVTDLSGLISNPFANLQNRFEGLENTMEDLTVNTQAADFTAEQNQVGMANTLQNMNQAAGGSGVAALAQALANQGQIANQKASISIAEQEKANQKLERAEAGKIQLAERKGEEHSKRLQRGLLGKALELSAGEVTSTAADINAAQRDIESGIEGVGSAVGTFAGGIG